MDDEMNYLITLFSHLKDFNKGYVLGVVENLFLKQVKEHETILEVHKPKVLPYTKGGKQY